MLDPYVSEARSGLDGRLVTAEADGGGQVGGGGQEAETETRGREVVSEGEMGHGIHGHGVWRGDRFGTAIGAMEEKEGEVVGVKGGSFEDGDEEGRENGP